MRLSRLLGILLLLILVMFSLVFIPTFFIQRGPSETAPVTSTEEVVPSNVKSVLISPSKPLAAFFFKDKLVYINSTSFEREGVIYQRVLLHIFDLRSERVASSIVIDEYPASSPEALLCGDLERGIRGYTPRYRLLGYDGRYVYYERDCILPREGVLEPLVYMVDVGTSTVISSSISSRGVVAVGDGVAYKYLPDEGLIEALEIASSKILWRHEYRPSYKFPPPPGQSPPGRTFIGAQIVGAWVASGSLIILLHDSDIAAGEMTLVYGLVVASREGVRESFFEALRSKGTGWTYDIRAGFDGERIYVLSSIDPWGVEKGFAKLHSISLNGAVRELLSRSIVLEGIERGSLGMLVGEGRVAIIYVADRKLEAVTQTTTRIEAVAGGRGGAVTTVTETTTWTQVVSVQVIEVLDREGNMILSRELVRVPPYSLIGLKGDKVYLMSDTYIYALDPSTGLKQVADLGYFRDSIGIVLPFIIPLIPFLPFITGETGETAALATSVDGTIYIYTASNRGGYLMIIEEEGS